MKIVGDENIPLLYECFSGFGKVVARPGRDLSPDDLVNADALIVRSVTHVTEALLSKAADLKFVGSCTAGVDHVDQGVLKNRGIVFAGAPGCNARAVVDYVLCALDLLGERDGFTLEGRMFGIIGKGQVGQCLYKVLADLGLRVLVNDPLCEPASGVTFVSREELIARCDVIALHTPLTTECEHPTYHLIGEPQLRAMKPGTVFISAGRGAVVDNNALLKVLREKQDLTVVLDVWESEPEIDAKLLELVDIGSPHIAGYSLDAKIAGTALVYEAFCDAFGLPQEVDVEAMTPTPSLHSMVFSDGADPEMVCRLAMRATYDIRKDDMMMRQMMNMPPQARVAWFDTMRKHYAERREFKVLTLQLARHDASLRSKVAKLGFSIQD